MDNTINTISLLWTKWCKPVPKLVLARKYASLTSSLSKNSLTSGSCSRDGWQTIRCRYLTGDHIQIQSFHPDNQWRTIVSIPTQNIKKKPPYLSRAALLLSTNSADEGSSFPTFTFVMPGDTSQDHQKTDMFQLKHPPEMVPPSPRMLFSGGGGTMKPLWPCFSESFSYRPRKSLKRLRTVNVLLRNMGRVVWRGKQELWPPILEYIFNKLTWNVKKKHL